MRDPANAQIVEDLKSENGDKYALAMQRLSHLAQKQFGVSLTELNLYDGEQTTNESLQDTPLVDIKGGAIMEEGHPNLGDMFIDATDGAGKRDTVDTLGHELIESVTALTGAANDAAQEDQAVAFGGHFAGRIDQAFENGLDSTATGSFYNSLAGSTAVQNGTRNANAASGAEMDNRQLMRPEMRAIRATAPLMAEREGISEQEAERRMAQELVGHVDASWQNAQNEAGRPSDDVALNYLAEALTEQGDLYDANAVSEVPVLPGEEVDSTYTAEDIRGLLQDFEQNAPDSFTDRTQHGEELAIGLGEQAEFYQRNFGRQASLAESVEQLGGEATGMLDVAGEMAQGLATLAKNPVDGAEAMAAGTVRPFVDPVGFAEELADNKRESDINVALDQFQGDYFSAGRQSARGDAEQLLELGGIIPLPANRAGALRHLDDAPSGNAQPLLLEYKPGVPAGQEVVLHNPNQLLNNAPSGTPSGNQGLTNGFDDIALEGQARQHQLLETNQGYNITSPAHEIKYPDSTIGASGTFVTDRAGFENVLGPLNPSGGAIRVNSNQLDILEWGLGLDSGTLGSGSVLRQFDNITDASPSSPFGEAGGPPGNSQFRGSGMHLPSGAPEITIDPQPRVDNSNITNEWIIEVSD